MKPSEWIGRIFRRPYCKHALGTRHCGNPRCRWYIGRYRT